MQDNSYIHELLTVNPATDSIYDIIGKMEMLLTVFKKDATYHGHIPFLFTYYLVTKKVAEKYLTNKRFFSHVKDIEKLDVYFASLYFSPFLSFLDKQTVPSPWVTYFSYCQNPSGIAFTQLLLGVNAHINADLPAALIKMKYTHQRDYFLVNDILQEVTPEIMHFLLTKHDLVGIGGSIFQKMIKREVHLVVERWRSQAWVLTHYAKKNFNQRHINNQTEQIAKTIITSIDKLYHLKEVKKNISLLHTLSVE